MGTNSLGWSISCKVLTTFEKSPLNSGQTRWHNALIPRTVTPPVPAQEAIIVSIPIGTSSWALWLNVLTFIAAALACGGESQEERNKAMVRRYVVEGWNTRDMSVADEILGPSYVLHDPLGLGLKGIEATKLFFALWHTAFPDYHATINHLIAEGDKVALQVTISGTHKGPFFGLPPTGKRMTTSATAIFRFADGKIVEEWVEMDILGPMQQAGLIPTSSPGQ